MERDVPLPEEPPGREEEGWIGIVRASRILARFLSEPLAGGGGSRFGGIAVSLSRFREMKVGGGETSELRVCVFGYSSHGRIYVEAVRGVVRDEYENECEKLHRTKEIIIGNTLLRTSSSLSSRPIQSTTILQWIRNPCLRK